jgi:hypothetical protein
MTFAPRHLAIALLNAAARLAPPHAQDWAEAMLRELDFVSGDWAALWWALGGVGAIFHQAGRSWGQKIFERRRRVEEPMNSKGKKAVGVVSGAIAALLVVLCAFGLLRLTDLLFPALGIAGTEWTHWLSVIVIPEAMFVAAVIVLWRKRGPIAVGILVTAIAIGLHAALHMAGH